MDCTYLVYTVLQAAQCFFSLSQHSHNNGCIGWQHGVQCLAQGHINMWSQGSRESNHQTSDWQMTAFPLKRQLHITISPFVDRFVVLTDVHCTKLLSEAIHHI